MRHVECPPGRGWVGGGGGGWVGGCAAGRVRVRVHVRVHVPCMLSSAELLAVLST
jgi:hypothetical protein